jgi:hypothetical protein
MNFKILLKASSASPFTGIGFGASNFVIFETSSLKKSSKKYLLALANITL